MGDRAYLVECGDPLAYYAAMDAARGAGQFPGVTDVVPAAQTVLVRLSAPDPSVRSMLEALNPVATSVDQGALVEIPVVYDGADLDEITALTGLSADEVVERHTAPTYDVAFCGFAPGFAYLRGTDPLLAVPRRDNPRTRVPAGAVSLAAGYTGVYPRATPGGWQLIGRTDAVLFDVTREPPALLTPGTRVRFRAVDRIGDMAAADAQAHVHDAAIEVIAPGPLTLLQDLGRPGHGAIAVGPSGAFDRAAHRLANRIVGNDEAAATLECAGGGLQLRAMAACTVAVTGAHGPIDLDGSPVARGPPLHVPAGSSLTIGQPSSGLRSYVAIRGGFNAPPVLGSLARDTMAGLGPAPIQAGDLLAVGVSDSNPRVDFVPLTTIPDELTLHVVPGPRADWFDVGPLDTATYVVTDRSDRMGIRLQGSPLLRTPQARGREVEPEGMVRGALQVPPDGQPVLLGPDHPVTGGYPVIAVVIDADLDACAQARPGTPVRFRLRE